MSDARVVVLRTRLYAGGEVPGGLRDLSKRFRIEEIAIDDNVEAMSEADWDRVLKAILDSDRCITV